MNAYRIVHTKWADRLTGSGYAARWNSSGLFVVYAAESCSLACLENLVHRNGFGLDSDFKLLTITIPTTIKTIEFSVTDLDKDWNVLSEKGHLHCRSIGDNWIRNQQSAVLIVPSAIILNEKNILINPNHPDFEKIQFSNQDFIFDKRLVN